MNAAGECDFSGEINLLFMSYLEELLFIIKETLPHGMVSSFLFPHITCHDLILLYEIGSFCSVPFMSLLIHTCAYACIYLYGLGFRFTFIKIKN